MVLGLIIQCRASNIHVHSQCIVTMPMLMSLHVRQYWAFRYREILYVHSHSFFSSCLSQVWRVHRRRRRFCRCGANKRCALIHLYATKTFNTSTEFFSFMQTNDGISNHQRLKMSIRGPSKTILSSFGPSGGPSDVTCWLVVACGEPERDGADDLPPIMSIR